MAINKNTESLAKNDPTLHATAVDIKVAALSSLLIDKGLVSEQEIIDYTQDHKNALIGLLDPNHPNTKTDKEFLDQYFKDYK